MQPDNVEGEVAEHVLSAVCQRRTGVFVVWALKVPSWGSSLWGNPERMSAVDVMVWKGVVRR